MSGGLPEVLDRQSFECFPSPQRDVPIHTPAASCWVDSPEPLRGHAGCQDARLVVLVNERTRERHDALVDQLYEQGKDSPGAPWAHPAWTLIPSFLSEYQNNWDGLLSQWISSGGMLGPSGRTTSPILGR